MTVDDLLAQRARERQALERVMYRGVYGVFKRNNRRRIRQVRALDRLDRPFDPSKSRAVREGRVVA